MQKYFYVEVILINEPNVNQIGALKNKSQEEDLAI